MWARGQPMYQSHLHLPNFLNAVLLQNSPKILLALYHVRNKLCDVYAHGSTYIDIHGDQDGTTGGP